MKIVAVVHSDDARAFAYGELARELGHELDERRAADGPPPPDADALLVLGGAMHVDQEDRHPWLRDERVWLRDLLEAEVPMLGVCLGAELLGQALGWPVARLQMPEIGWYDVELAPEASADPLIGVLPPSFPSFQWHSYAAQPPDGARPLAESAGCAQAYRVGERSWGVQFHPEVTAEVVDAWLRDGADDDDAREAGIDPVQIRERTRREIAGWNALGRELFARFLELAGR